MYARLVALGVALVSSRAAAQSSLPWPRIALNRVAGGFSSPTQVTSAHDGTGRLFVVEQRGLVRIVKDGAILPTPVPRHLEPRELLRRARPPLDRVPAGARFEELSSTRTTRTSTGNPDDLTVRRLDEPGRRGRGVRERSPGRTAPGPIESQRRTARVRSRRIPLCRNRGRRRRRRHEQQRAESRESARQDSSNGCRRAGHVCDPALEPFRRIFLFISAPRDLGVRPPKSVAVLVRPEDRGPPNRRRRAGRVGGGRLPARGRRRRRELRLAA